MKLFFLPVLLSLATFAGAKEKAPPVIIQGSQALPPLPETAFTIVVIPDTQSYLGKGTKHTPESQSPVSNPNLAAQVDWIIANIKTQNIAFVTHVGDIVDKNVPEQWAVAKQHLDRLHGVVPFALTVGNHDMTGKGNASRFQQHFPASDFKHYPWYVGSFENTSPDADPAISVNNVNSAQKFSAGGIDFIHLSLECNAPDNVLDWADQQLKQNTNRQAIITTHMDLGVIQHPKTAEGYITDPKGRMQWTKNHGSRGNNAEQMWDKLYRKHANLHLILSGDQSRVTALRLTQTGEAGNPITSLLSDYQSQPVLRLMRFIPARNEIDVISYDVTQQVLVDQTPYVKDVTQHQFKLSHPLKKANSTTQSNQDAVVVCEGHYPRHVQGVCQDATGHFYWSWTTKLVKTTAAGKIIHAIDVADHHGDLCHHDGRIYVAVNLGKFNLPPGSEDSWVYVYDAASLTELSRHKVPELVHGAGGMAFRDKHFFIVGGLPDTTDENYVYEYDASFRFIKRHVLHSKHTHLGIQTAEFDGQNWWFGCYGTPSILLRADADLIFTGRWNFDAALGIIAQPDGTFLVARNHKTKNGYQGFLTSAFRDGDEGLTVSRP